MILNEEIDHQTRHIHDDLHIKFPYAFLLLALIFYMYIPYSDIDTSISLTYSFTRQGELLKI